MNFFEKRSQYLGLLTSNNKLGILALFFSSLADASFLPLPVTTFFLFLLLLNKEKSGTYILFVLSGTVTGAIAGYLFGRFALLNINGDFSRLGMFLLNNIPGYSENMYNKIQILFSKWNFLILCGSAATPIPYGIFSVFSGAFKFNFLFFLLATIISQGAKYYIITFSTLKLSIQIKKIGRLNWKPSTLVKISLVGLLVSISNLIKNLFQIN